MGERIRRLPFQTGPVACPDGVLMQYIGALEWLPFLFARLQRRERCSHLKKT